MDDNLKLLESIVDRATEYTKTSFELLKLKGVDKVSDIVSTLFPRAIVIFLSVSCLIFLNLGLAFWLGEILGKIYYGFFAIAGLCAIEGIIIHFLLRKWFKKLFGNYLVKQLLK